MYFRYKWLFIFLLIISISIVFTNTTNAQTQCPSGKQWSISCGKCISVPVLSGTCSSPTGGTYDACGNCVCSGVKGYLCSGNTCQAPAPPGAVSFCQPGQTYDPCTGCVGKASVILNPDTAQSGLINITGDLKSAGDLYLANGKAIRVDKDNAVSNLNIWNWGSGNKGTTLYTSMGVLGTYWDNSTSALASGRNLQSNENLLYGLIGPGTVDGSNLILLQKEIPGQTPSDYFKLDSKGNLKVGSTSSKAYLPGSVGIGKEVAGDYALDINGKLQVSGAITWGGVTKTTWPGGATYTGIANQITVNNTNNTVGFVTNPVIDGSLTLGGVSKSTWLKAKSFGNLVMDDTLNTIDLAQNPSISGTLTVNGQANFGGNVGIGIPTPSQKLDVNGYVKGAGLCISSDCRTSWPISSQWTSDSNNNLRKSPDDGNVAIGFSSASEKLDVNGKVKATGFCIGSDCDTSWPLGLWSKSGSDLYYSSGNVGINTSGPSEKLDVNGKVKATGLCLGTDCKTSWPVSSQWVTSGSNIYYKVSGGKVGIGTQTPGATLDVAGGLAISQGGLYVEQGVVDSYFMGDLGIGTLSAQEKLHVSGNILGNGDLTITGKGSFTGDIDLGSRLKFKKADADGGSYAVIGVDAGATKDFEIYDYFNGRPMLRIKGDDRDVKIYGRLTVGAAEPVQPVYRCTGSTNKGVLTLVPGFCGGVDKAVDTGLSVK